MTKVLSRIKSKIIKFLKHVKQGESEKLENLINPVKFRELYPRANPELGNIINRVLLENSIDTQDRICAFLSQCSHESAMFSVTSENLNYSESALNAVFGKYFARAGRDSAKYARNPEKIANVVYSGRMGNGPESSGDGWKYRGRGYIQLTGKNNYTEFEKDTGFNVLDNPDIVANNPEIALMSAVWYWNKNNLNKFADSRDILGLTRAINGGTNGLEDRRQKYDQLQLIMHSGNGKLV